MSKLCECGQPVQARGMCQQHYNMWYHVNKNTFKRINRKTFEEQLSDKVTITGFCWLWTGATAVGYGSIWNGRISEKAHRWIYRHLIGPIPEGAYIDHLCRVRLCVNPDHLEAVSQKENMRRGSGSLDGVNPHCKNGHRIYGPEDWIENRLGTRRECIKCRKARYDRKKTERRHILKVD